MLLVSTYDGALYDLDVAAGAPTLLARDAYAKVSAHPDGIVVLTGCGPGGWCDETTVNLWSGTTGRLRSLATLDGWAAEVGVRPSGAILTKLYGDDVLADAWLLHPALDLVVPLGKAHAYPLFAASHAEALFVGADPSGDDERGTLLRVDLADGSVRELGSGVDPSRVWPLSSDGEKVWPGPTFYTSSPPRFTGVAWSVAADDNGELFMASFAPGASPPRRIDRNAWVVGTTAGAAIYSIADGPRAGIWAAPLPP
jgi:hypothetical protein